MSETPKIGMDPGYLYDHSIEIDIKLIPEKLQELISQLEAYDKVGDWVSYDPLESYFESRLKIYVNNHIISESLYKKLLLKYGWVSYD